MKKLKWGEAGSHPKPDQLLAHIEDELPESDALAMREHLKTCWACRTHIEQMHRGIYRFIESSREVMASHLPPPPSGWEGFAFRLDQSARNLTNAPLESYSAQERRGQWASFLGAVRDAIFRPKTIAARRIYAAAGVALAVIVAILFQTTLTPALSARELLTRAGAAESAAGKRVRQVSIRVNGNEFHRTLQPSPAGSQAIPPVAGEARARALFERAKLDWNKPLSAAWFASWRDGLSNRTDELQSSDGRITLRTETSGEEPIREASLTVVDHSWLPVAETVRLADGTRIEILEVAGELPDQIQIGSRLAAEGVESSRKDSAGFRRSPDAETESLVVMAKFDEAEMQVRVALHSIGADLGDDIQVTTDPNQGVLVTAILDSEERKLQILNAIGAIPYVKHSIRLASEAAAHEPPAKTPAQRISAAPVPLFQADLERLFSSPLDRARFVNRVIEMSGRASMASFAIRKLLDRYTGSEVRRLAPQLRSQLEDMIRDHTRALLTSSRQIAAEVSPLVPLTLPAASYPANSWRSTLIESAGAAIALHENLLVGLGGSAEGADAEVLRSKIAHQLRLLESVTPSLLRQTDSSFLVVNHPEEE